MLFCCYGQKGNGDIQNGISGSEPNLVLQEPVYKFFQKLHHFYLQKGLFGVDPKLPFRANGCPLSVRIKRTSQCFNKKVEWMKKNEIIDTTSGDGRRKRKAASKDKRDEMSNSNQRKKKVEEETQTLRRSPRKKEIKEETQTLRRSPRKKEIQTTKTQLRRSPRKTK